MINLRFSQNTPKVRQISFQGKRHTVSPLSLLKIDASLLLFVSLWNFPRCCPSDRAIPLLIELNSESKPYLDRELQLSIAASSRKVVEGELKLRSRNSDHYYTGYDYDFDSCYEAFRQKLLLEYGPNGPFLFGTATQRNRYANQGANWVWATMKFENGDWAHEFIYTS